MSMEEWLSGAAARVPLEIYCFFGGLAEELIAPIPSALVMASAGTLAHGREAGPVYMSWLAFLGAAGKSLGALVIYAVSIKAEEMVMKRFGKFLGIRREQIEKLRSRLQGGWKDFAVLTLLRAVPVMPGALISAGSGFLKVPVKPFVLSAVIGYFLRDLALLYAGFGGKEALQAFAANFGGHTAAALFLSLLLFLGIYVFVRVLRKARKPDRGGKS